MILPSSTKLCWQDAWMNEDIENFYGSCISASIFKGEFIRKGEIIIVQIREPEGIGEASEEELEELTDVLVNNYGRGSFTIGLASFCDLVFSFPIVR
jgi:hypothetical protein